MVAPIRDFRNITTSALAIHFTTDNMSPNNISNIEVNSFNNIFEKACNNFDKMRGHSLTLSTHCPRTLSLSSSDCDGNYNKNSERK